jgi:hypothetical protein
MPAPQAQELSATAKQHFSGRGISLPMKWQSMGELYPQAFQQPELSAPATPSTSLFHEPTLNKYHTDTAGVMSGHYEAFIDGITTAISNAIDKWMKMAMVVGINAVGPVGTWIPNGVNGPDLYPMIMADAPKQTRSDVKYSRAIAAAVSTNWNTWHQGLSGTLTYPGFNGAPMPNTPVPLMSIASAGESGLAPENLSQEMQGNLKDPGALHAVTLFDAVAQSFYTHFQVFKSATLVTGVTVAAAGAPPPPITAAGGVAEAPPADPEADRSAQEDATEEDTQDPAAETELEEPPPPTPGIAGTVIPTPGNFV